MTDSAAKARRSRRREKGSRRGGLFDTGSFLGGYPVLVTEGGDENLVISPIPRKEKVRSALAVTGAPGRQQQKPPEHAKKSRASGILTLQGGVDGKPRSVPAYQTGRWRLGLVLQLCRFCEGGADSQIGGKRGKAVILPFSTGSACPATLPLQTMQPCFWHQEPGALAVACGTLVLLGREDVRGTPEQRALSWRLLAGTPAEAELRGTPRSYSFCHT